MSQTYRYNQTQTDKQTGRQTHTQTDRHIHRKRELVCSLNKFCNKPQNIKIRIELTKHFKNLYLGVLISGCLLKTSRSIEKKQGMNQKNVDQYQKKYITKHTQYCLGNYKQMIL